MIASIVLNKPETSPGAELVHTVLSQHDDWFFMAEKKGERLLSFSDFPSCDFHDISLHLIWLSSRNILNVHMGFKSSNQKISSLWIWRER